MNENDLLICREWMKPFYEVLSQILSNSSIRSSQTIPIDEVYLIQTHNISIDLLVNLVRFIKFEFYFIFIGKCLCKTSNIYSNINE